MNERLNNLVGQAKVMAEETLNKQISKNAELDAFAEKFAELIVRECADLINSDKDSDRHVMWNRALYETRGKIFRHFGVEE